MKKPTKFFSVFAFLSIISLISMAQSTTPTTLGDGDDPYLNSVHSYSLSVDGVHDGTTNIHTWAIIPDGGSATDLSSVAWASITNASSAGGTESVEITFDSGFFSGGDYVLRYTENIDGCPTYRDYPLTVRANGFYLAMDGDGNECNVNESLVFDWATNGATLYKTSLVYKVTANADAGFSFTNWEFKGTLGLPASGITVAFGDISTTAGTLVDLGSGVFRIENIPAATTSVDITLGAESLVTTQDVVTVTISEGKAITGGIETPDNGTGDANQVITLKKLAGATNIVAN